MRGCPERALGTIQMDAAGVGCFQDLVEIFTEMEEVVFFEDRFPCIREWSHVVENPIIHATSGSPVRVCRGWIGCDFEKYFYSN